MEFVATALLILAGVGLLAIIFTRRGRIFAAVVIVGVLLLALANLFTSSRPARSNIYSAGQ